VTARVAGALALAAVAGFLLGACGGGGGSGVALSTRTGPTGTRPTSTTAGTTTAPATTRTLPARTTTVETTTVHVTTATTTAARPTTTRPPLTVTVLPPTTSTTAQPTTSTAPAPVAAPPTTSTTSTAAEPESETPWGWIALVLGLTGVAIVVIVLWGRRRSRTASWTAHLDDLRRRTLIALDAVVAQGSVVAGQIEALAAEARDLERHAAGEQATSAVAPVRAGLDELAEALEADRTLRLATPPPTPDQLAYSDALIRQQAEQLRGALRSP
jgi:hypothetical protein